MRIGISCNRFGRGGGLERYALDIAGALAARSDEPVVVYARDFDESAPRSRANAAADAADAADVSALPQPIEAHRIAVGWLPGKLRDYAFSRRLQRLRRHSDVLIGCNRVRGADIAICGGTHRGYLAARGAAPRPSDRWQIALEADHYAGAHRVVAHSRMMQAELRELYTVPQERIALLYPPVDTARFAPVDAMARRALRERHGFRSDEVVFLFVSSGHERKGLALLADYFGSTGLPVTLAVAGRPVGKPLPRVRELGYCSNVEDLYRAADFSILASDYEPFGLVGVESVLCGTPLVFADNIGCLEVIGAGAVHAFSRAKPQSLSAAVESAVASVREGTARLGEPRAMLDYDPGLDRHAEALLALCEAVLVSRNEGCWSG